MDTTITLTMSELATIARFVGIDPVQSERLCALAGVIAQYQFAPPGSEVTVGGVESPSNIRPIVEPLGVVHAVDCACSCCRAPVADADQPPPARASRRAGSRTTD